MLLKLTIFQPTLNQLAFSCFQECERELESMMFYSNKANHKIFLWYPAWSGAPFGSDITHI